MTQRIDISKLTQEELATVKSYSVSHFQICLKDAKTKEDYNNIVTSNDLHSIFTIEELEKSAPADMRIVEITDPPSKITISDLSYKQITGLYAFLSAIEHQKSQSSASASPEKPIAFFQQFKKIVQNQNKQEQSSSELWGNIKRLNEQLNIYCAFDAVTPNDWLESHTLKKTSTISAMLELKQYKKAAYILDSWLSFCQDHADYQKIEDVTTILNSKLGEQLYDIVYVTDAISQYKGDPNTQSEERESFIEKFSEVKNFFQSLPKITQAVLLGKYDVALLEIILNKKITNEDLNTDVFEFIATSPDFMKNMESKKSDTIFSEHHEKSIKKLIAFRNFTDSIARLKAFSQEREGTSQESGANLITSNDIEMVMMLTKIQDDQWKIKLPSKIMSGTSDYISKLAQDINNLDFLAKIKKTTVKMIMQDKNFTDMMQSYDAGGVASALLYKGIPSNNDTPVSISFDKQELKEERETIIYSKILSENITIIPEIIRKVQMAYNLSKSKCGMVLLDEEKITDSEFRIFEAFHEMRNTNQNLFGCLYNDDLKTVQNQIQDIDYIPAHYDLKYIEENFTRSAENALETKEILIKRCHKILSQNLASSRRKSFVQQMIASFEVYYGDDAKNLSTEQKETLNHSLTNLYNTCLAIQEKETLIEKIREVMAKLIESLFNFKLADDHKRMEGHIARQMGDLTGDLTKSRISKSTTNANTRGRG